MEEDGGWEDIGLMRIREVSPNFECGAYIALFIPTPRLRSVTDLGPCLINIQWVKNVAFFPFCHNVARGTCETNISAPSLIPVHPHMYQTQTLQLSPRDVQVPGMSPVISKEPLVKGSR